VYGGEKPVKVLAGGHLNEHGIDESVSITFIYAGGKTATLACHTKVRDFRTLPSNIKSNIWIVSISLDSHNKLLKSEIELVNFGLRLLWQSQGNVM
jgi:hypothetical protein